MILHVYEKEVKIQDIGLPDHFIPNSIEDLIRVINIFDSVKICKGAISSNKYKDIKHKISTQFVESCGQWRHMSCTRVLVQDSRW